MNSQSDGGDGSSSVGELENLPGRSEREEREGQGQIDKFGGEMEQGTAEQAALARSSNKKKGTHLVQAVIF